MLLLPSEIVSSSNDICLIYSTSSIKWTVGNGLKLNVRALCKIEWSNFVFPAFVLDILHKVLNYSDMFQLRLGSQWCESECVEYVYCISKLLVANSEIMSWISCWCLVARKHLSSRSVRYNGNGNHPEKRLKVTPQIQKQLTNECIRWHCSIAIEP